MGVKHPWLLLGWLIACGPPEVATPPPGGGPVPSSVLPTRASEPPVVPAEPVARTEPCPDDMIFVDTTHCENAALSCEKSEYEKSNHLTICHRFKPGQTCKSGLRRQRYCIDPYEYPNEKGGHPPVNVSAFDGATLCAARGKRLCYESEWVAACEGPDKLPFPYGLERSKTMCNIDNRYIAPSLERAYSTHAATQDAELRRLDQSVPSGSMETCKSGFGVYDLTGNFDEWVLSETERGVSDWAGLKGGAWGHVRNACRPITTSHPPQFTYYFISFRCCKDADTRDVAPPADDVPIWHPPPPPPRRAGHSTGWAP